MIIGTSGTSFTLDGKLATYLGFSEFRLLERFLRQEDIKHLFDDRNEVLAEVKAQAAHTGDGAWLMPTLRVFGMLENITRFHPQDYPNYYTSLTAVSNFAGENGFCVQWEALADAQYVMPNLSDQRRHWEKVCEALRDSPNVIISLGNEFGKNGFKPEDFSHPNNGRICSRGSDLGGNYPYLPAWDCSEYHTRRDNIKGLAADSRYLCFVVGGDDEATPKWPGTHPVFTGEWLGAGDNDEPGRRTKWPDDHYRDALAVAAWAAGGIFHSDNGIQSVVFSDQQRACAKAYVMGISKVDPVQRFQGKVRG